MAATCTITQSNTRLKHPFFLHCINKQALSQAFPKNESHGISMTKHRLLLDTYDSTAETLKVSAVLTARRVYGWM